MINIDNNVSPSSLLPKLDQFFSLAGKKISLGTAETSYTPQIPLSCFPDPQSFHRVRQPTEVHENETPRRAVQLISHLPHQDKVSVWFVAFIPGRTIRSLESLELADATSISWRW